MLRQKIDALKLLMGFFDLAESEDSESRYSLLDATMLLLINDHPASSKADLCEIFYGDRNASKSSLDRPIARLIDAELIDRAENMGAATRDNEGRVLYSVGKKGEAFLKRCSG